MRRPRREYEWLLRLAQADAQGASKAPRPAEAAYRDSQSIYGYRKVHDDLEEQKVACCHEKVCPVLREELIFATKTQVRGINLAPVNLQNRTPTMSQKPVPSQGQNEAYPSQGIAMPPGLLSL